MLQLDTAPSKCFSIKQLTLCWVMLGHWPKGSHRPFQTLQAIVKAIGYFPHANNKDLMLKILLIYAKSKCGNRTGAQAEASSILTIILLEEKCSHWYYWAANPVRCNRALIVRCTGAIVQKCYGSNQPFLWDLRPILWDVIHTWHC